MTKIVKNDLAALLRKGAARRGLHDYVGAIEDYTAAIELAPKETEIYFLRGLSHKDLGNVRAAIADFSTVIAVNPDFVTAYKSRALLYTGLGEHQSAIEDWSQIIRLNPEDAEIYSLRGSAKRQVKDLEGALADFTQMIRLNPSSHTFAKRGFFQYELGDFASARSDLEVACELDPTNSEARDCLIELMEDEDQDYLNNLIAAVEQAKSDYDLRNRETETPLGSTNRKGFFKKITSFFKR